MVVTLTNIPVRTTNPKANAAPFFISSGDNLDTNLQTPAIKAIDADTPSNNPPSLAVFRPLSILVAIASNLTKPTNNNANTAPLIIAAGDNFLTILQTITISPIASANLIAIPPTLLMSPFAVLATAVNAIMKPPRATTNNAPFPISGKLRLPMALHTFAMISNAADNSISINPNRSMFLKSAFFITLLSAQIKAIMLPIMTTNPANP